MKSCVHQVLFNCLNKTCRYLDILAGFKIEEKVLCMQIYLILYSDKGTEKGATGHCKQTSVFVALQLILNIVYIFVHENSM